MARSSSLRCLIAADVCLCSGRVKAGSISNDEVLRAEIPWPSFQAAGIITKEQLAMIYHLDKQHIDAQLASFEAVSHADASRTRGASARVPRSLRCIRPSSMTGDRGSRRSICSSAPSIRFALVCADSPRPPAQNGTAHVELFKELIASVSKDEVVQYVLAMLDELLTARPALAGYFHMLLFESKGFDDALNPMMKLLTRQSLFVFDKATSLLARILSYTRHTPPHLDAHAEKVLARHLCTYAEWVLLILKSVNPLDGIDSPKVVYTLNALQQLLSSASGRAAIVQSDGLPVLVGLMSGGERTTHSAVQLLYHVVFCVWSLSYSAEAAMAMATAKLGLVGRLVEIIKSVQKEKVVRVALATLRNLVGVGPASSSMVSAGILKGIENLQQRKWADEDVLTDLEFLHSALQINLVSMNSWEVYSKEIASERLEWSPSHKSEAFWRDNCKAFEGHNMQTLKQLVALLESREAETLAIACHDIGQFIKVHPEGRRLMTQLGAKGPVMALLKHNDSEVQKHALNCVQRLMIINWEYLSKN